MNDEALEGYSPVILISLFFCQKLSIFSFYPILSLCHLVSDESSLIIFCFYLFGLLSFLVKSSLPSRESLFPDVKVGVLSLVMVCDKARQMVA